VRRPRHRPSEPLAPRPSDRIASRFAALADFAARRGVCVTIDGARIDASALAFIAREESGAEEELAAVWKAFQDVYVPHTERVRAREAVLLRIISAFERPPGPRLDAGSRAILRACKLRNPPRAGLGASPVGENG
jgi:hypothetical protein